MSLLKARLKKEYRSYLTLLGFFLLFLFYITSLLSKNSVLNDTVIDILIYGIYLLLVLVVGSMSYIGYLVFDEVPLYETLSDEQPVHEMTEVLFETPQMSEKDAFEIGIYQPLFRDKSLSPDAFEPLQKLSQKELLKLLGEQHPQLALVLLMQRDDAELLFEQLEPVLRQALLTRMQASLPVTPLFLKQLSEKLNTLLLRPKEACQFLASLNDAEIRELLRHVTKKELMFALKRVKQELQERFLANISSPTAERLRRAMREVGDGYGLKRHSSMEKLCLLAKQLREDGKISASNQVMG